MSPVWDVIVVGSGAGGGTVAFLCASAGLRTLVIEKGKEYRRQDYTHDELAICRRNFFVPYMADEPRTLRETATDDAVKSNYAWISSCVGGGTVHWSGYSYRFSERDFDGWPFTLRDFEPHYTRAEALIGVTTNLHVHPLAHKFEATLRTRGKRVERSPRAILERSTATRGACVYCDSCGSYGCETGAKGSSQEALLAPARATGRCDVWSETMATRVVRGSDGKTAAVELVRADGTRATVHGRTIVLAASAIETARLLLISQMGNSSGLLGKGLMFLTVANGAATFRKTDDPLFRSRAPFFDVTARTANGVINFGMAHPNPIFNAEKIAGAGGSAVWGRPLVEQLKRHFREGLHLDFEGYSRCTRMDANRVDLDPVVRDRFGLPVARITFRRDERDRRESENLAQDGEALFREAGADRVDPSSAGESLAVVQSGTCRMGRDPRASVLAPDGRLHDAPNIYVADSASFPSSGSVPHTLTIVANALRVGESVVKNSR